MLWDQNFFFLQFLYVASNRLTNVIRSCVVGSTNWERTGRGLSIHCNKLYPYSELQLEMFYVSTFRLQRQDTRRNTQNNVPGGIGATWPTMNSTVCSFMFVVLRLTANYPWNLIATKTQDGYNHFRAMSAKCTHPGVSGVCQLAGQQSVPISWSSPHNRRSISTLTCHYGRTD